MSQIIKLLCNRSERQQEQSYRQNNRGEFYQFNGILRFYQRLDCVRQSNVANNSAPEKMPWTGHRVKLMNRQPGKGEEHNYGADLTIVAFLCKKGVRGAEKSYDRIPDHDKVQTADAAKEKELENCNKQT